MSVNAGLLAMAAFLATVTNRLVEGLIKPVFDKFKWDKFWLMYVAWVIGAALVFATGINLFPGVFVYPVIGQVLTALVAGGGANLLNDLFDGFK
jgi:hypothetical protein